MSKTYRGPHFAVGIIALAGVLTAAPAAAAELEVQVSKVRNAEGKVVVCRCASRRFLWRPVWPQTR